MGYLFKTLSLVMISAMVWGCSSERQGKFSHTNHDQEELKHKRPSESTGEVPGFSLGCISLENEFKDQRVIDCQVFMDDKPETSKFSLRSWRYDAHDGLKVSVKEIKKDGLVFGRYRFEGAESLLMSSSYLSGAVLFSGESEAYGLVTIESRVAKALRTLSGASDANVKPGKPTFFLSELEAEDYTDITQREDEVFWNEFSDYPGTSGATALRVGSDTSDATGFQDGAQLTYQVNTPKKGTMVVWVRCWATDTDENSIWVNVGASEPIATNIGRTQDFHQWYWDRVGEFAFDEGNNTLTITRRERGIAIDKILVTSDPKFNP